jgi:hypothetical protein
MDFIRIKDKNIFELQFSEEEIKILNKNKKFTLSPESASKFANKLMGAAIEIRSAAYKIDKNAGQEPVKDKDTKINVER